MIGLTTVTPAVERVSLLAAETYLIRSACLAPLQQERTQHAGIEFQRVTLHTNTTVGVKSPMLISIAFSAYMS
jgi:hypothetical protein